MGQNNCLTSSKKLMFLVPLWQKSETNNKQIPRHPPHYHLPDDDRRINSVHQCRLYLVTQLPNARPRVQGLWNYLHGGQPLFNGLTLCFSLSHYCQREKAKAIPDGRCYLFTHCGTITYLGHSHTQYRINTHPDVALGCYFFISANTSAALHAA